ncbi:MAG: V-type ATP synthase subunit E family protein [Candidatus Altiarchaeota archaeon]
MGLEDLKDKIRKEAEEEISRIRAESESQISRLDSEVREEAERESEKIIRQAEKDAASVEKQVVGRARMDSARRVSSLKNQLLGEFFQGLHERILQLPEDEKRGIIRKMLEGHELLGPDPVILVDGKYAGLVESKLEVRESDVGDFGVIIESRDGSARIDGRLGQHIGRLKPSLMPKVTRILFE